VASLQDDSSISIRDFSPALMSPKRVSIWKPCHQVSPSSPTQATYAPVHRQFAR
jgi:hypothetical protein